MLRILTVEELLVINTLERWQKFFGWKNGTIYRVKEEINRRLRENNLKEWNM